MQIQSVFVDMALEHAMKLLGLLENRASKLLAACYKKNCCNLEICKINVPSSFVAVSIDKYLEYSSSN